MSIFVMPQASAYGQNVKPFDGAKLYFYESGTTTPKNSYSDPDETIANANPVIADGNGLFGSIYISGLYKAVLTDKNDVQIWSEDELSGFGDAWSLQGNFDSSTNSGEYPASGQIGYVYRVTEAFTLNATSGAYRVNIGDYIIANKNGATGINADWDIIRGVTQTIATVALTDGANISTDCSKGTTFTVTLGGNRTLDNPTNKLPGETYTWVITQDATGDRTLSFGTDFVFGSQNKLKTLAASVTVIRGVVISSTVIRCHVVRDIAVDFEAKNLLIDVASNTTVTVTADSLSLLNESGDYVIVENVSDTFDIATDIHAGTEKASHWYQLWVSVASPGGALILKMAADYEGTADGTTAGYLDHSTHTLKTDGYKRGDILYNTTDLTQTTLAEDPSADGADVLLADDIMVSGETYKIRSLSPTNAGEFKARIGAAYNNSSSNLDDSTYTHIQNRKKYRGEITGGDYQITLTGATLSAVTASAYIYQVNDWTGRGIWNYSSHARIGLSAGDAAYTINTTGIIFSSDHDEAVLVFANNADATNGVAVANTNTTNVADITNTRTAWSIKWENKLVRKPTFHT